MRSVKNYFGKNVNVIYLRCFNFVGVFEPFFFSGRSFSFVCVIEPFLFHVYLPFEYQKPTVGLN